MSSPPDNLDLEGIIEDNYGYCSPEMVAFFEPYRKSLEQRVSSYMDDPEDERCSWRDFRWSLWDGIPEFKSQ